MYCQSLAQRLLLSNILYHVTSSCKGPVADSGNECMPHVASLGSLFSQVDLEVEILRRLGEMFCKICSILQVYTINLK